jgi:hypothetical protein
VAPATKRDGLKPWQLSVALQVLPSKPQVPWRVMPYLPHLPARVPHLKNASRRRVFNRARADALGQLGRQALSQNSPDVELYFDALCCAIVLMREGRLLEDDDRHGHAYRALNWLRDGLHAIPETAPYVETIMRRIRVVAGEAIYVLDWPDSAEIEAILSSDRKERVAEAESDSDPLP